MKLSSPWLIPAVLTIAAASLIGCAMMQPIGDITLIEPSNQSPTRQIEAASTNRVEVTAYVTGWVEAPGDILIDQSDPGTPTHLRQSQWVPSLAFAVIHPEHGVAILDTGLRAGTCDYGLRPIYWVPCRNEPGDDLVSQLKSDGIRPGDIRFIMPSHFHGDHISGLNGLLDYAEATVLATKPAISNVRSRMRFAEGIPTSMVASDMRVQLVDDGFRADVIGTPTFDVFGDGSLKLFQTPGHTEGHLSALARGTERDIIFTFDASHLKANFDLGIPSGSVSSRDAALTSLETIRTVSSSLSNPLVVFGHEPSQWTCIERNARLDLNLEPCIE